MFRRCCVVAALLLCAHWTAFSQTEWTEAAKKRSGEYEITLRLPVDGVSAGEETEIEFRIVDATKFDAVLGATPLIRAIIQATIDMPAMLGMPKYEETAHPEGIPGNYGVHPNFAHGGEFRLKLAIQPPVGAAFETEFPIPVLDAVQAKKRKPRPPPFRLELTSSPKRPKAGEIAELSFVVRARDRKEPVTAFDIAHERPIHAILVRDDLAHFAHEHPELQAEGVFRMKYTFPAGGDYRIFADVAPRGAGSQVLSSVLKVAGNPGERFDVKARRAQLRSTSTTSGVTVAMQGSPQNLPTRKTMTLNFAVTDAATGKPVSDLEPYLGAMAHMILINEDGITFVHSHPDERAGRDGILPFVARFPKPGLYRAWVQVQRHGAVITNDFVVGAVDLQQQAAN